MPENVSATQFIERLTALFSQNKLAKSQLGAEVGSGETQTIENEIDKFEELQMGQIFALAKEFIEMPSDQIEILLENHSHNVRVGALSIMDKPSPPQETPESRRKALFDLYLGHSDKIDNWDLVDLGCLFVVGGYLFDKPRDIIYRLAHSKDTWERRTAIFNRLRSYASAAGLAGIYVSVMFFEGFTLHLTPPPDNVEAHPFYADNNINGVTIGSIVD